MPELQQNQFKRQVAYKVRISDILGADFIKNEFSLGYIQLNDINVLRVNIIATLVYKSEDSRYASAIIDDGTGKIVLRSFEGSNIFSKADVGDAVLTIGKVREFSNEKYIIPEILKKLDNAKWANVRKLEMKSAKVMHKAGRKAEAQSIEESTDFGGDIYSLIKQLDRGEGVPIDEIVKSPDNANAETTIKKLLESGDIFEIKPGKLKVLE